MTVSTFMKGEVTAQGLMGSQHILLQLKPMGIIPGFSAISVGSATMAICPFPVLRTKIM